MTKRRTPGPRPARNKKQSNLMTVKDIVDLLFYCINTFSYLASQERGRAGTNHHKKTQADRHRPHGNEAVSVAPHE